MSETRERPAAPRRTCPFCQIPYTARMTAWLGPARPCACCDGSLVGHWPIAAPQPAAPTEDLSCDHCGKVLYLAVRP